MLSTTRKECIKRLNNLQSNYATLVQQEQQHLSPLAKFAHQRKLIKKLDEGRVYERLRHVPIIHVAGTKGKGSTCAFIESLCRSAGLKTGFFSSPHLVSVTERIRVNGTPIDQAEFASIFEATHRQLAESERPAYFAFLALMAYKAFVEAEVEVMVMEVGIGGAFCATNVYPPFEGGANGRISCISALGYDHTNILGSTIEQIAANKCGIIHPFTDHLFVQNQSIKAALPVITKSAAIASCHPIMCSGRDLPSGAKLGLCGELFLANIFHLP